MRWFDSVQICYLCAMSLDIGIVEVKIKMKIIIVTASPNMYQN